MLSNKTDVLKKLTVFRNVYISMIHFCKLCSLEFWCHKLIWKFVWNSWQQEWFLRNPLSKISWRKSKTLVPHVHTTCCKWTHALLAVHRWCSTCQPPRLFCHGEKTSNIANSVWNLHFIQIIRLYSPLRGIIELWYTEFKATWRSGLWYSR